MTSVLISPRLVSSRIARIGGCRYELTIGLGVLMILLALLLPKVLGARELSRRWTCQDNLRKIGTAIQSYHERHLSFPPGYFPSDYAKDDEGVGRWSADVPSFAWSSFLLFDLGEEELYEDLGLNNARLDEVVADPSRWMHLRSRVSVFRCPSDQAGATMDTAPLPSPARWLHPKATGLSGGSSSYVGNGGYFELQHPLFDPTPATWKEQSLRETGDNNGVFFPGSSVHSRQIVDGLSQTIAIGERAWYQGSSTWTGTRNVQGVSVGGAGVCLGRVWWPINAMPMAEERKFDRWISRRLATKENGLQFRLPHTARNGFGSYHLDGAYFLMADGSVSFLSSKIDFRNTIECVGADPSVPIPEMNELGLFQRLGIRNDSASLEENL